MVFCFFRKRIQLLIVKLREKMIAKAKSFYPHGKSNSSSVWICFIGSKKVFVKNKLSDNNGRTLIFDVEIDPKNFILINLYNPNTVAEQLETLSKLMEMLTKLHLTQFNNITCAEDSNLFFNVNLRVVEEIHSVRKQFELKETYNLKDTWRMKNPKAKQYTFQQKHVPRFLQRRLDNFFISSNIQEFILDTDKISDISSDHSPTSISFSK